MHFNKKEIMGELKGKKCRQFFGRKIEQFKPRNSFERAERGHFKLTSIIKNDYNLLSCYNLTL